MVTLRKVQPGLLWIIEGELVVPRGIDELAAWLGVTAATVRRWLRGDPIPRSVQLALRFLVGRIENPAWSGFHVGQDRRLWTANSYGFLPAELEHFSVIMHTNRSLWRMRDERSPAGDNPANQPAPEGPSAAQRRGCYSGDLLDDAAG